MNTSAARFIGVGVGPGDPELMTIKAQRLILQAKVICYLANPQGESQARHIARNTLQLLSHAQTEIPVLMPMSNDRALANTAYDQAASAIQAQLEKGVSVVFLCEGDPLFFGSFAYLLERLQPRFPCEVVPGISSINSAAAALQHPLTMLKESLVVVSGRHTDQQIQHALVNHDSVVIMKAGRARPRILALLKDTGRWHEARYLENIGRANQRIISDMTQLEDQPGPYFSLFVLTRSERSSR